MKVCPICGTAFYGSETFCPHDGARLFEAQTEVGKRVHDTLGGQVTLERWLFADELGERYMGQRLDGGGRVRVTLFNMGFVPSAARVQALSNVRALLESPLPAQLTELLELNLDAPTPYLIESDPQGASLRTLLKDREHLDWPTAVRLICACARVIEWLDQSGVVHRALHPHAIHVTHLAQGQVCVAEWAHGILAYQANPLEAAKQGLPLPYSEYLAPELVEDASRADRRSGLYTLGILLYELLVGQPPHTAPQIPEVLKRHRRERPGKLSVMSRDPSAGTTLDDLFELITGREPDSRFQAPLALVNALSTLLQGHGHADFPALTRRSSPVEPLAAPQPPSQAKHLNGHASPAPSDSAGPDDAEPHDAVEDARKETLLFINPSPAPAQLDARGGVSGVSATQDTGGEPALGKKKKRKRREDSAPDEPPASTTAVEDAARPTEQMDLSGVLAADRQRLDVKVKVDDPEAPSAHAGSAPSTKIVVEEAALHEPSRGISGSSQTTTEPALSDASTSKKKKRKTDADASVEPAPAAAQNPAPAAAPEPKPSAPQDAPGPQDAPDREPQRQALEDDEAGSTTQTSGKKKKRKTGKTEAVEATPAADPKAETKAEMPKQGSSQPSTPSDAKAQDTKAQDTKAQDTKAQDTKAKDAKAKDAKAKEPADKPREATKQAPAAPATPSASSEDNLALPEDWFSTSTERAWDQTYLEEHSQSTERRFRTVLTIAFVIFVILCAAFLVYIFAGPETAPEEDARRSPAVEANHQLA